MNRIISILVYGLIFSLAIWQWQSLSEEMKDLTFYTVFFVALIQGNYFMFKLEKLQQKLQSQHNDE
jgi:uncharacterized membrane protein YbjE (DUF340 family)